MQWMAELSPKPIPPVVRYVATALLALQVGCVSVTGEDPSLRTTGTWLDDEVIEQMASRRIDDADERLAISHVNVVSYDGIVLLTGQVEDKALRDLAEQSLRGIRKIRKIHNEIQIGGAISLVAPGAVGHRQRYRRIADQGIRGRRSRVPDRGRATDPGGCRGCRRPERVRGPAGRQGLRLPRTQFVGDGLAPSRARSQQTRPRRESGHPRGRVRVALRRRREVASTLFDQRQLWG